MLRHDHHLIRRGGQIVALHRGAAGRAAVRQGVEQILRRLAADDAFGNLISVPFVEVATLADAAVEADAAALLHHVRGLVGGEAEIGCGDEADVVAGGEGAGAHDLGGRGGLTTDVGPDVTDVVMTEALLDGGEVGQGRGGALDAAARGQVDGERIVGPAQLAAVGLDQTGDGMEQPGAAGMMGGCVGRGQRVAAADAGGQRHLARGPGGDVVELEDLGLPAAEITHPMDLRIPRGEPS